MQPKAGYTLGHCQREMERLTLQARLFEPFTKQLLIEAGLKPGMRVLDIGSGAGDVAMLAASIVGPEGEVVGIDTSPGAVDWAQERARGMSNVRFVQSDAEHAPAGKPFDAVIGRLVLGHMPDPLRTLRKLVSLVRAGGRVAFQEFDISAARSHPKAPVFDRCMHWMSETFKRAGANMACGLDLYSLYLNAGLQSPSIRLDAAVGCGPGHPSYLLVAEVVRSLAPLIEKFGVADAHEIELETLRDRIEAEVVSADGVVVSPALIGAWAEVS